MKANNTLALFVFLFLFPAFLFAQADSTDIIIEKMMGQQRITGLSLAVVKKGKTIVNKGLKKSYYTVLERTQKGDLDITNWLKWFLECLKGAIVDSNFIIDKVVRKHQFFVNNASKIANERQRLILTKLLDGFEGNLTSSKYAKIAKTSPDTALRDIKDLVEKGILVKSDSGGRSTNYLLNF